MIGHLLPRRAVKSVKGEPLRRYVYVLRPGDKVRALQAGGSALLEAALDDRLPDGVVRVPAGHSATSTLGAMFGAIRLERA